METYATFDSYIARMRRREQVNGKDKPEELMLLKFRKTPFSVYFKWLGSEGQGREVVYVNGQNGSLMHTLLAAGDMPFAPAGKRMALAPDSILVRAASRGSITEAGIGTLIDDYGRRLAASESDSVKYGTHKYLGLVTRPEFSGPQEGVDVTIPPNLLPQLPRGGRRLLFFDYATHLPDLLITYDSTGHEVEYYCYDRFQYPVRLDDNDFNPDVLWPAKK